MSSSELQALRLEIESLRGSLSALRLTVEDLRSKVADLEGGGVGGARSPLSHSHRGSASASGHILVSPGGHSTAFSEVNEVVDKNDSEGRLRLAQHIGRFFRRALDGSNRGSSGRDSLNLASRLYVVLADFEGNKFEIPRIYREFRPVAALCKKGPNLGASIFVGFATEWKAKEALTVAGFSWPGYC